jgi:hypothetical protein
MPRSLTLFLGLAIGLGVAGCSPRSAFTGPTVSAFVGRLTHNDQPVSFAAGEKVTMQLFHEKGRRFGVPIKEDGTFKIGWMPIGTYSASLLRETTVEVGTAKARLPGAVTGGHPIPGGLTIEEGKTEYTIELGPDYKP